MITVLRLNHRVNRDKRISTHAGLTSRALGADEFIYTGDEDSRLTDSVRDVVDNWGGSFRIRHAGDYMKVIKEHKREGFLTVHLTMYGLELDEVITDLRKEEDVLFIIGGSKVPGEVYEIVDYNMSVTNQPHSEISALAVALHEYHAGKELSKKYEDAGMRIKPSNKGKEFF